MSKTKTAKKREQLRRFWEEDPHCRQCGTLTVLPNPKGGYNPPHAATLEHLVSRFDPARRVPARGQRRHTLFCLKCNVARGRAEELKIGVEELRRRAGRPHENWKPSGLTASA